MASEQVEDVDGEEVPQPDDAPVAPKAQQTYTSEDGTVYSWNGSMWLPQVDEDLLRRQQETYGGTPSAPVVKPKRKYVKKPKPGEAPEVVENERDLYVEGLPLDITMEEFLDYFAKAGIIRKDEETGFVKAKIYKTPEGKVKGDGLICYYKKESVDLAISILDGAEIKRGHPLKLSVAKFTQKPEKKKKKKPKNKKARSAVDQKKDLGWEEKESLHVVIKNLFDPKEALDDADFMKDLREDIAKECTNFGPVDKVTVFEFNPEGIVVIKFKDAESSEKCLMKMAGRFFAGKKLQAEYYDGVTNYYVEESEEMKKQREEQWASYLDGEEETK